MSTMTQFTYIPETNLDGGDWIPHVNMGDLVDQYNEYLTSGEFDWWGSLHNDTHPEDCEDCIDINIWVDEDENCLYHGEGVDCIPNPNAKPHIILYPTERDIDDVNGIGVDQWIVDTSVWFDITEYLFSTVCGECLEYKPDDDRVYGGMKCGECAYGL